MPRYNHHANKVKTKIIDHNDTVIRCLASKEKVLHQRVERHNNVAVTNQICSMVGQLVAMVAVSI